MAAADRVAADAVGVAMLKQLGSNRTVMQSPIFDLRQIKRAAELGVGVKTAAEIDLIAADKASRDLVAALRIHLSKG